MACSKEVISDSVCTFTLNLYKQCVQQQPSENAFMSPTSVMVVMAMLQMGARGDTEQQISQVLNLSGMDTEELAKEMDCFVDRLKAGGKQVILETGNGLFPGVDHSVLDEYLKIVTENFKADVKTMDYKGKTEASRQEINKWVESETKGKIKNLLPSGSIDSLTAMVVVNAIYFKGDWNKKFSETSTSPADFYVEVDKKIQVNMMRKKIENCRYVKLSTLACQAVELLYVGKEIGMVILLPNERDGLARTERELKALDLKQIVSSMISVDVNVRLPKFKLEASYQMKNVLSALGMPDLFKDKKADLSGIGKDLHVSEIVHKAFVDVNEEGTEAAAATGVVVKMITARREYTFTADHPFIFMIWDHKLDVPLFIGRVTNPGSNG